MRVIDAHSEESGHDFLLAQIVDQFRSVISRAIIVRDTPVEFGWAKRDISLTKTSTASPPAGSIRASIRDQFRVGRTRPILRDRVVGDIGSLDSCNPGSNFRTVGRRDNVEGGIVGVDDGDWLGKQM